MNTGAPAAAWQIEVDGETTSAIFEPAANADNDVLVVGAGPAGMECAMILAKRGLRRAMELHALDRTGPAVVNHEPLQRAHRVHGSCISGLSLKV